MKSKLRSTVWLLCGVLLVPMLSQAAILVQISGIPGHATGKEYGGFHQVDSIQWEVARIVSSSGAQREASAPNFSELTLTRTQDDASSLLFFDAIRGGEHTVSIRFVDGSFFEYLKIDLEQVVIASMSSSASGGEPPHESITLNFGKIRITTASAKGSTTKGWDLAARVPW